MIPKRERAILPHMRIIAKRTLREFWSTHTRAQKPLEAWHDDVKRAKWQSPNDIKSVYANASFLNDNRVVFNIKGNSYRVIVKINYHFQIVYIRFVGTHKDYDNVNAQTV